MCTYLWICVLSLCCLISLVCKSNVKKCISSCLFQTVCLVCIFASAKKKKKLFQKSQISELCVSLSNTESRTEYVSSVTTVSPSVGLCSSSSSTLGFPFPTLLAVHSLHLHCGPHLLMKDCQGSVLKCALMTCQRAHAHAHTTMPALCHIARVQGSSITSAQTLSQSHTKTEVWHINVKQISLTFISPNNTTMACSQAHQPTILTS